MIKLKKHFELIKNPKTKNHPKTDAGQTFAALEQEGSPKS